MQVIDDVTLFSELVYDYAAQDESEEVAEDETDVSKQNTEVREQDASETPTPVKTKRVPKQKVFQNFTIQRIFKKAGVYQLLILQVDDQRVALLELLQCGMTVAIYEGV